MEIWQVAILGIVQGASEFLPISSTAHLILTPYFFGWSDLGLVFDVALHLGTFLAVVIFFWGEWWSILQSRRLLALLVLGTLPGIFFGFLLESAAAGIFRSPILVAFNLAFWGIILWLVDVMGGKVKNIDKLGRSGALFVGLCQALAILPGVSRSGITMSGGLFLGLKREAAVKFSFLLSAPIILGSVVWEGRKILDGGLESGDLGLWSVGVLTSFISGFLAIKFLLQFVQKHSFLPFVVYRLVLAAVILVFLLVK